MSDSEQKKIGLDYKGAPIETLETFVDESSDPAVFDEILRTNDDREEVIQLLYKHPNTPKEVRVNAASALNLPMPTEEDLALMRRRAAEQGARDKQKERLVHRIAKMGIADRVKLAMKGSGEARSILIKESNKIIIMAVMDNPRITDSEVLAIAKSRTIIEDALRVIIKNKDWMKNYSITHAMVSNPKTPAALAMRHLTRLKKKDIKLLAKDKGVSEAVRSLAKKFSKAPT